MSIRPVEYIESTGTQWIDTGFTANQDTSIEIDYMPLAVSGDLAVFGSRYAYNSRGFAFHYVTSSNYVLVDYGSTGDTDRRIYTADWGPIQANVRVLLKLDQNRAYKDGALVKTYGTYTFTTPYPLTLFGLRDNSATPKWLISMRLYGCKIWDNGTLVRDFRPVRDSDGAACLYDAVSGSCFYNAGTGYFRAELVYDQESFLTGLAVGRMLWRPPTARLTWTCDPAYLVFAAGTDLGTSNGRHFYKTGSGFAVGVYAIHRTGSSASNWYGPVLISTDPEAVKFNVAGGTRGYNGTLEYGGLTWYANSDYHYANASYTTGALVLFDAAGIGGAPSVAAWRAGIVAILEAAQVRVVPT